MRRRLSSDLCGVRQFRVKPARFMPRELRPPSLEFRLYYKVMVFPADTFMRGYAQRRRPEGVSSDHYAAITLPSPSLSYRGAHAGRLLPKLGELCLWSSRLGTSVLSHEAVHLAIDALRTAGQVETGDPLHYLGLGEEIDFKEERLAYLTCGLCRQIVEGLYDLGLLQVGGRAVKP